MICKECGPINRQKLVQSGNEFPNDYKCPVCDTPHAGDGRLTKTHKEEEIARRAKAEKAPGAWTIEDMDAEEEQDFFDFFWGR